MINHLIYSSSSSEEEREVVHRRRRKIFCRRINFDFTYSSQFYQSFRMSPENLESVLRVIGRDVAHSTGKSGALTPKQQLCLTIHWLGTGSQFHVIGRAHGVHESTVCRAVKRVVASVNRNILRTAVKFPEDLGEVVNSFYNIANFPHVIGVVDGSLIQIDAPSNNEYAFVDRKGSHSLNCMFVCGPSLHFYYVNASWPGSVHDARVLRNSSLYRRMQERNLFPNGVLIGDTGYPLKPWLMTPMHVDPRNAGERRYNRRLKSTRHVIECALGILKEKFPCLNYLRVNPVFAANIIKCRTALCNIARQNEDGAHVDAYRLNDNDDDDDGPEQRYEGPRNVAGVVRQQEIIEEMM